jgi:Fe-S-cluster containining protein
MMNTDIDYCAICTTSCCEPCIDVKVTYEEYERVYAAHADDLEVVECGGYYEVSSIDKGACPHFIDRRCAAYDIRPMECRLFPYSMQELTVQGDQVKAYVHAGTRLCQFKSALMPSETEVREMIQGFLDEAYPGLRHEIVIEKDPNFNKLRLMRYRRKLRQAVGRMVGRTGARRMPAERQGRTHERN